MYLLTHEEQQSINQIQSHYYMLPTLQRIEQFVHRNGENASSWREVFNNLHPILVDAKIDVDILLQERKLKGQINDISQARKSIAGAAFSNALAYVFIKKISLLEISNLLFS